MLERATAEIERVVAAVPETRWNDPSPCAGWDAKQVVHHVIAGNVMADRVLAGASGEEAIAGIGSPSGEISAEITSADPVAKLRETDALQLEAFRSSVEDPDRIVHHPRLDIPVWVFFNFRIGDLTLHAWDIARATGIDESLDPELVEAYWASLQPLLPAMTAAGVFGEGASGTVPDDAPTQLRVLDATGRRP